MKLFNDETLKDLKDGLKSITNKLKEGFGSQTKSDNDNTEKTEAIRCTNCGAQFKANNIKIIKCEYCGTEIKNPNYTFSLFIRDDDEDDEDS